MLMIPAIDLKDGRCVRLRQGRMADATLFSDDPVAVAVRWQSAGARRLHLVDLNGAFAGRPVNGDVVAAIAARLAGLPIQIGGGIRNGDAVEAYLRAGVSHVIIGTRAVQEPAFVDTLCRDFPGRIIVGIDARGGLVATDGWAETSDVRATALAQRFAAAGVNAIIYTDIERDGMMHGVNIAATREMAAASPIPVIASGGIATLDDIRGLLAAARAGAGIAGAIIGRALYEGTIDFAAAQTLADAG